MITSLSTVRKPTGLTQTADLKTMTFQMTLKQQTMKKLRECDDNSREIFSDDIKEDDENDAKDED